MRRTETFFKTIRKAQGVLAVFFTVCFFGAPVNALADEGKVEGVFEKLNLDIAVSGTMDFYSQYVWRGFALDTDPVFQPGFSMSGYGFTFTFWSSWDGSNNDAINGDEIDYVFDYTKEFELVKVSLGHTYYDFPGTGSFSKEFYSAFSLTKLPLTPTITFYHDYGNHRQGGGHGQYVTLKLSQSITLIQNPDIVLNLSVVNGYNRHLFIRGNGGNTLLSAGVTVPLTANLSMTPSVNYSLTYGDLKDEDDGNQKNRFYAGVSFAYAF